MDKKFYKNNRKRLFELLPDKCVAVVSSGYSVNRSADEDYDFTANNNFFYLTGIKQAEVHLILIKDGENKSEKLYIDAFDEMYAKWIGHKLTKKEASDICGIAQKDIFYKAAYEKDLDALIKEYKTVYIDLEKGKNVNYNSFGLTLAQKLVANDVKDIYPLVIKLRSAKQNAEIELFKEAIDVTKEGINELMRHAKPGMYEYQLEAYYNFSIKQNGNREFAFKTIAASGKNATTLHYSTNDCVMQDGDLILFDLGARAGGYCADISRTFPINGKFNELQKTIYNIVLAANKRIIKIAKAGMTIAELQAACVESLTQDCLKAGLIKKAEDIKKYYFHGVSHSIGLDTHDPIDRNAPLPVGAVISDEPGLYFPEYNIGVRIEDDLLLLKSKAVNLSEDIIKEVDDIEAFMSAK
ncbi:MAG: aminopeptidase P N-terminal domain-containing protein [Clostridiales bacterium]|nr:aminopeptidase P N-terminal domain-containing protein [Clostridiales bacterium]